MKDKIRSVSVIGDVEDINCFSGTSYHFFQASKASNMVSHPWRLDIKKLNLNRIIYNLLQISKGRKWGGFQYSDYFEKLALKQIETSYFSSQIIAINQFFPSPDKISAYGGEVYYYIDATFKQLLDRYDVSKVMDAKTIQEALKKEKKNFEGAKKIVAFQNWCKDSVINDYNISPAKVEVILPGANIFISEQVERKIAEKLKERKLLKKETPFVLGFIGKDWKRKGLPRLIELAKILINRGWNIKIRCAGYAPTELDDIDFVEFVGFIDKKIDPEKFHDFILSCDLGCLFSTAEFSSISVLEFLRFGIPVAGFTVDGMGDLFFPDCSLRFGINQTDNEITNEIESLLVKDGKYEQLRINAYKKSKYVTWQRCVEEWKERIFND